MTATLAAPTTEGPIVKRRKILVTGTGRSGTGWAAAVLNTVGIRCGHQAVFKHQHTLTRTLPTWGDWEADASYEAVPLLRRVHATEVTVAVLIRHPLDTIRSWLEHGAFGDDMPRRFSQFHQVLIERFPPVMTQATPVDRAALYWFLWNAAAVRSADQYMTLGMTAQQFCESLAVPPPRDDVDPVDPAVDDKVTRVDPIDWDDIRIDIRRQTLRLWRDTGNAP